MPTPEEIEAYAQESAELRIMEQAVEKKRARVEAMRKRLFESPQSTGPPDAKFREVAHLSAWLRARLGGKKPTKATAEIVSFMIDTGGAVTVADVAKQFGLTTNAAQARLLRGVNDGWFTRVAENTYSIGYPNPPIDDDRRDEPEIEVDDEGYVRWK